MLGYDLIPTFLFCVSVSACVIFVGVSTETRSAASFSTIARDDVA